MFRSGGHNSLQEVGFAMNPRFSLKSLFCLALILTLGLPALFAQEPDQQAPAAPQNQQSAPPEAGGPDGGVGPYAIPKKREEPPPPPPETPKKVEGMPDYSINVTVPVVDVPVSVVTKDGQFVSGLKKDNFRVFEDGVPQTVTSFNQTDAPITAVLLIEFSEIYWQITQGSLEAAYSFANALRKNDWTAVEYYDMKPHILVDFTQNKQEIYGALNQLRIPEWHETNLFDALYDTVDRLERVEGHKYIILISSGYDSFSKLTLDQMLKKLKTTHDITIYPISIGWIAREMWGGAPPRGVGIDAGRMDYLQADNEMQTFAKLTGGRFYQPRFEAEYPEVFQSILGDIRNQYVLAYRPTNAKLDGTYRKLKVEVVAPDGQPLKVRNEKGKDMKYEVIAREGYTAKHTVE
jgi:VWFA-related protein